MSNYVLVQNTDQIKTLAKALIFYGRFLDGYQVAHPEQDGPALESLIKSEKANLNLLQLRTKAALNKL